MRRPSSRRPGAGEAETATSGTYSFNPNNGELILFACSLAGLRRTELTQQHMADARGFLNLLFSTWANDTPNLWTVDLVTTTLVPGQASYAVASNTIMVLDAYIRTNAGQVDQFDRIIWPISRTDYASMPNKEVEAPPTVFWFDRLLSPTITLWQTPDDAQVYELQYYRCIAIQDADVANGQTADIPPRWLMATVYNLAEMMNQAYPVQGFDGSKLAMKAEKYLNDAITQDVENVPTYIAPAIGAYYRR